MTLRAVSMLALFAIPFAVLLGCCTHIDGDMLTGALVVLAGWAADPAFVAAQWHSFAG